MRIVSQAAIRRPLCLPEGYRVREIDGRLYLFDPDGVPLAGPADAETIDQHAWRDAWRRVDDELREEMAALRAGARPIHSLRRVRQYLRMVDAIGRQQAPETPPAARAMPRRALRWGVLLASAAAAAAVVIGPRSLDREPRIAAPKEQAPPVRAGRPKVPAASPQRSAESAQASSRRVPAHAAVHPTAAAAGATRPPHPTPSPGYGVVVAVLPSADAADRVMHTVRGKGYVVEVVARGGVAQVSTPAYRTREQAERVARGLRAIGMPAQVIAMRGR